MKLITVYFAYVIPTFIPGISNNIFNEVLLSYGVTEDYINLVAQNNRIRHFRIMRTRVQVHVTTRQILTLSIFLQEEIKSTSAREYP